MKKLLLLLLPWMAVAVSAAPASTVPISQMPVTTNVSDNAYFPLIQPYPGRTTNDNFRATTANIFQGRATVTATNIIVTNLFVTNVIILAGTNVASVNPTIGRLPYKDTTNTFGDSALYFIDTNTVGAVEVDTDTLGVTNLVTGGVVQSVDSGMGFGYLTNIVNGSGALTNDGAGNLGWSTFASTDRWTNSAGLFQPVDLTQPLFWTNRVVWGSTDTTLARESGFLIWTNSGTPQAVGIGARDALGKSALVTAGGNIGALRGDSGASLIDALSSGREVRWWNNTLTPTQTGSALGADGGSQFPWSYGMIGSSNQWGFLGVTSGVPNVEINGTNYALATSSSTLTINATDTYLPARLNATTFTNSPLYTVQGTNFGFDRMMFFGPGATNRAYRTNDDLYFENGLHGSYAFLDGAQNGIKFNLSVAGNPTIANVGGNGLLFDCDTNYFAFIKSGAVKWYIGQVGSTTGELLASIDNTIDIGLSGNNRPRTVYAGTSFNAPKLVLTGTTNQVVFGGTNTAPVNATTPVKWISVQVATETNIYRLPLYE